MNALGILLVWLLTQCEYLVIFTYLFIAVLLYVAVILEPQM